MKLKLQYPVSPYIKFQSFGENGSCRSLDKKKYITKVGDTCPVGYEDFYLAIGMKGHNGIDMFGSSGLPCYASHDGWVHEVQTEEARGLGIGLVSHEKFELSQGEFHIKTRYWHLKGLNVEINNHVKAGDLIGWCDNTGASSGDHLHFELKLVDEKGNTLFKDNGYNGAIDPEPYLVARPLNRTVQLNDDNDDVVKLQKALSKLGFFKVEPTGYYGTLTRNAVFEFQKKYVPMSWYERNILRGARFGEKSLAALNKVIHSL
jgi:hypothetical protein